MPAYLLRVWLPDRPGALGAVASRIGAVRGDVIGIDILERGAGRVIDELVVALPEDGLVDLLVAEVSQVDGVDVEDVRPTADPEHDAPSQALETAARLVEADGPDELLQGLCEDACVELQADWAVIVGDDGDGAVAACGEAPSGAWVRAFVEGSRYSEASGPGPEDVAWATLGGPGLTVVLGRRGRPLRAKERRMLRALARIAAARWRELKG